MNDKCPTCGGPVKWCLKHGVGSPTPCQICLAEIRMIQEEDKLIRKYSK